MTEYYKNLVRDVKGDLTIRVPVISGNKIGLDNTCKSDKALEDFFFSKDNIYNTLESLKSDIEKEYLMACTSLEQIKDLEKLYEQVIKYQHDINEISQWRDVVKETMSEIPKEILDTLAVDPFIGAISLDPKGRDDFVRIRGIGSCTFGIRSYEGVSEQILSKALRSFLKIMNH